MQLFAQISVEPVFGWAAVIPLAIIMLASLWLTLTAHGISRRGRLTLMSLRLLSVLVLLLGWLRPGLVSTSQHESSGAVAVLMDRSQSMELPSNVPNRSRWEIQQDVWAALVQATDLSIGKTKVVPYFYDSQPVPATASDLPSLTQAFSSKPSGRATDLGKALSEISRLQLDPPLRAVIVMGDGTQTLIPPAFDASQASRQLAQRNQPVLMVGIGPDENRSLLRDVAIEGMPEYFSAFVKKELGVKMVINARGMQGREVKVSLRLSDGKRSQVVESRTVIPSSANEKMPLEFKIAVAAAGEYLLGAQATVDDVNEQNSSNNRAISFITVREGGVKILYLEGQPRSEQLFLKRSLDESLDFDVEYAWFPQRDRKSWPIPFERKANLREYDAIVLGDLDASALSAATQTQIIQHVRRGGGLLLLGGYHAFDGGGYGRSNLARLFPVELGLAVQQFDAPISRNLHIEGDIQLTPTRPHPITSLRPEPENTRLWQSLPPLSGMNRLGKVSAAPGVQVLLAGPQREPALVTGQFERGRVLAFAGDTTWRWWLLGGQKQVHQQFWRQAMLWLVQRDSVNEGFRLKLDRRRLLIDETPDLAIEWFGGSDNKAMPDDVRIEVQRDGSAVHRVSPTDSGENQQQAKLTGLSQPGLYKAILSASGEDGTEYQADIAFVVNDESLELSRPAADWRMMENIVAANQSAGGQLLQPDQIGSAVDWLRERQTETQVKVVEKRRLGDAAWDAWLYLLVFCILMSVEWALRKSWQLP